MSSTIRGMGATPLPEQAWQIGKTAASIAFVQEAERALAGTPQLTFKQVNVLSPASAAVKCGKRALTKPLSVADFLANGFPPE